MNEAETGQIILPTQASRVQPFIDECISFKGEVDTHDDQVEVLANAVNSIGMGDVPRLIVK